MAELVLTLSCPDRTGIVHAVAAYLHEAGCNVLDAQQFGDRTAVVFFMRVHLETGVPQAELAAGFVAVAAEFGMEWELHDTAVQPRVLIMVSKAGHCLNDLLYRRSAEQLRVDVPLVMGNHRDLEPLAAAHGVPFEYVPVGDTPASKQAAEERILNVVMTMEIDFVVLARFMKILSPNFVWRFKNKIINIHPSLLPSFPGPQAYRQAYERGVKIAGCTAHFVNMHLDDGPIIAQGSFDIRPGMTLQKIVETGQKLEAKVLLKAVKSYLTKHLDVHWGIVNQV